MQENQPPQDQETAQQKSMGKWMMVLAWLSALLLLTVWFDDLLLERFNPNTDPSSYSSMKGVEVRLKRNVMGHYITTGKINGQNVTFLLDTGATDVSIPAHLAPHLGLLPGARVRTKTANGTIIVRDTNINELNIGDIQLFNVEGNLNPGLHGDEILLGMSALKKLEFQQKDGWLILRDY